MPKVFDSLKFFKSEKPLNTLNIYVKKSRPK